MAHFVYMWTNRKNGKKYIGSHSGTLDDGYVSSGTVFMRAYNKNPGLFERTIMAYAQDRKQLLEIEQQYLDLYNVEKDRQFYNVKQLASGGNGVGSNGKLKGKKRSKPITNPSGTGTKWINNGEYDLRIKKVLLEGYLNKGWKLGRLIKTTQDKKWYYNPETKDRKMFYDGQQPDGYQKGMYKPKPKRKLSRTKSLITPAGRFETIKDACKYYNKAYKTIVKLCKESSEWKFVGE